MNPSDDNTASTFLISFDDITWLPSDDLHVDFRRDIFTEDQYLTVLKCTVGIRLAICLGGSLTNVLNIRTFLRIGLEDTVTIVFFNLAISDILVLAVGFAYAWNQLCLILETELSIHFELKPFHTFIFLYTIMKICSEVTLLLTTYVALQRCLCVARPLHFKGMFTRQRTFGVIFLIWVFCLFVAAYYLPQYELKWGLVPKTNLSAYSLTLKPHWHYAAIFLNIVVAIVLNLSCQAIILVSVFIMAHALKKSVQFRESTSNFGTGNNTQNVQSSNMQSAARENENTETSKNVPRSSKEHQAIVQVIIVSIIFLITIGPYFLLAIVQFIVPDFSLYKAYHNTFSAMYEIQSTLENLNSAVNFFVYYKYNSKFRRLCFRKSNL